MALSTLPVIDLDLFRENPTSVAARSECLKVTSSISNAQSPKRIIGSGCSDYVRFLIRLFLLMGWVYHVY